MIGTIGRLGVMPHILYQSGNNAPFTGTNVPFCYRGGMMKDTTVEELLTKMLLLSEEHLQSGINEKTSYQKYRARTPAAV